MFRKFLLAVALLLAPGLAHADWHEATSKHFVVYSDDTPDRLREFTEELERFDLMLRKLTGTPDNPISPYMRVKVFMVRDVSEIQKLANSRSIAGFYSPRASGPVAFVPRKTGGDLDAQTILQHEYGHSFMFSSWPSAVFAKWFVEGFAEFVGTAYFRPDGSIVVGQPPQHRQYGLLKSSQLPASRLLMLNPGKLDGMQSHVLYGRGWLLTHYSILGGHAAELGEYIRLSNAGKTEEAARAFGSPSALDTRLSAYAERGKFPALKIVKGDLPMGEVTMRKLGVGEAAIMPAVLLSTRGVNETTAPAVAARARALAAPFPNDPAAQNELAEAEFDAKNYAAAEAAADRALAADPQSMHALLYKGMAQMEVAKAKGETDPQRWRSIRSWFLKANKLDANYPQPLVLFYESFEAAKQKPSESAETGLLGAYVLAPFDLELRSKAGKVLLRQNKLAAARVAFEPIAYSPHMPADNPALDVLKAMDSGGAEAALKAIEEAEAKAKAKKEEADKKKAS
jgi:tetratricopeptide (TPR) repeat protein